ncbi:DUF2442 domain-containing protein [Deinococcus marmoris]|uniref:HTH cro/C1-type domain-containing protein n=1 Tax=Deinococcus marmoris TaxID=249408 RepID=A0A1U7P3N3_9DEIO|nr:DUF2442 domain-containing protein [Deinococcus marmoris]OLV19783.1 hypothetical protein BOO71_0001714 [Deinococcus marmoris]
MYKLAAIVAEAPHILHLTFTDGAAVTADVSSLPSGGGVFAPLEDPAFFNQVAVGVRGRSLGWPGELDLDADSFRPETYGNMPPEFPLSDFVPPQTANPVSQKLRQAVEASGEAQAVIAQRAGMRQQALSRLIDPYYEGHSLATLTRLADALGMELRVELVPKEKRAS